ncbi:MAG: PQQ-binding-like beta-propeller repeat protein [Verrucomicrobiales bacterium]
MTGDFFRTFACVLFTLAAASAADWPQFLGPLRDGHSTEKITEVFSPEGPRLLWKNSVGRGLAGAVASDKKVVLFHRQGDRAVIEAFDAVSGKKRWRFDYPTDFRDSFSSDDGPRSPVTIAGSRVFAYGAEGHLHALDFASGRLLWQRDLANEFAAPPGWFGRCCAPLVAGDLVLLNVGGEREGRKAGVVALAVESGQLGWTASDDEASYSSPTLTRFGNQNAAVFFTRKGLELIEPLKGTSLFKESFEPDIDASVTACTPVLCGPGRVFLSACYGVGACVWEFATSLKGRRLWHAHDRLDCHYGTPVFVKGHFYGFHGRQEQGQELRCIDASTGEVKWRSPQLPAGSVLAAANVLAVLTEKGELLLVSPTPSEFKVLARTQILGAVTRAYPALANGILYARDERQLIAVDLTAR